MSRGSTSTHRYRSHRSFPAAKLKKEQFANTWYSAVEASNSHPDHLCLSGLTMYVVPLTFGMRSKQTDGCSTLALCLAIEAIGDGNAMDLCGRGEACLADSGLLPCSLRVCCAAVCASIHVPHSFRTRAQYASRARRRALSQVGGNKGDRVRPSRSIPFDLRDAFLSDGASGEHERAAPVSAALSRPWECDLVQQHVPLCKRFDQVQLRHLRRWRAGCRAFIHPWCRLSPSL